jgi:hypothetical protein
MAASSERKRRGRLVSSKLRAGSAALRSPARLWCSSVPQYLGGSSIVQVVGVHKQDRGTLI